MESVVLRVTSPSTPSLRSLESTATTTNSPEQETLRANRISTTTAPSSRSLISLSVYLYLSLYRSLSVSIYLSVCLSVCLHQLQRLPYIGRQANLDYHCSVLYRPLCLCLSACVSGHAISFKTFSYITVPCVNLASPFLNLTLCLIILQPLLVCYLAT